jgi:Kdo2-lipid IVA lauroyltransferase/acyltransferase
MISFISSIFYYGLLIPFSYLPFSVIYRISDGMSWLMYRVLKYRKKDITKNLRNSFPEKQEAEIQQICRKFYRHLCDTMLESVKTFTVTESDVLPRIYCKNPEAIDQFVAQNKSVLMVAGHYSGFEWLVFAVDLVIKHQTTAVYRPLNNAFFDQKIRESRSRMGLQLVSMYDIKAFFENGMKTPNAVVMAMDQAPSNPKNAYWMTFLNQDTPVLFGSEKYAKEYDLPVVFAHLEKNKRGVYGLNFEVVTSTPRDTAHGEITEKMMRLLEQDIQKEPAYWLWSHRRWKHQRTDQKS